MTIQFGNNPVINYLSDLRDFGLEWVARRYYGLYGGEAVSCADDEQGQSRICVKVGILGLGTVTPDGKLDPSPISRTALPATIYGGQDHGMYFPPEVGDPVWVSFDHGNPDHPRVHGSWWRNKDPNRSPGATELPSEFRMSGEPKRRGIKTKFGHGVLFSDEESRPYVALWSGKQTGTGTDAVRKQQITLSDATGVKTAKDESVDAGIYANTLEGLRMELNDTEKTVLLGGNPETPAAISDNSFKIEELPGGKITIKTKGVPGARNEIVLDATTGLVTINATGAMNVTAAGAITLAATGGVAMGSGAAPPAPAVPGASVETGAGTKLINFAGIVTETLGGFVQSAATVAITAATSFNVTSPLVNIGIPGFGISLLGGLITIGNPIIATRAMQEEIMSWLESHTHTGNLGAPTPVTPTFITGTPASLYDPTNPTQRNPIYITNTKIS